MSQVLIIDDSAALRAIQWRVLCHTDFGFETSIEAHDCDAGLERLVRARDPSLVLVDLDIGGGGATEFVRAVRAQKRFANLPIVLVSSGRTSAERALAAGATACLERPFTVATVQALLEAVCAPGTETT